MYTTAIFVIIINHYYLKKYLQICYIFLLLIL